MGSDKLGVEDQKRQQDVRRYGICLAISLVLSAVVVGGVVGATSSGSAQASTLAPTDAPTVNPASPTVSPVPTINPSAAPSTIPTTSPTLPTQAPTAAPSRQPTSAPSLQPTTSPTTSPTMLPSSSPSLQPTTSPTTSPTSQPTSSPSPQPTSSPSSSPSRQPTAAPTQLPTSAPTQLPTDAPTLLPTSAPTIEALTNAELKAVMNSRLRMTFGWRDVCGASCTSGPAKFASVFDSSCTVTILAGDTSDCVIALNKTFGTFNFDGSVGNDDRLYLDLAASSLSCGLANDEDCATGTAQQRAVYALGFLCVAIGWRDSCSGCTLPPARFSEWCVDPSLNTSISSEGASPGSILLDGIPGDDDNLYISAFVHPAAPSFPLLDYARSNCHVTLGWRDVCNGCLDPPFKRGSVGFDGTCFDVVGSASLCVGSYASVNADGTISSDDTLYAALTCD